MAGLLSWTSANWRPHGVKARAMHPMTDSDRNDSIKIFDFGRLAIKYLKMTPIGVS